MNVLRAGFTSKQKKLKGRREKGSQARVILNQTVSNKTLSKYSNLSLLSKNKIQAVSKIENVDTHSSSEESSNPTNEVFQQCFNGKDKFSPILKMIEEEMSSPFFSGFSPIERCSKSGKTSCKTSFSTQRLPLLNTEISDEPKNGINQGPPDSNDPTEQEVDNIPTCDVSCFEIPKTIFSTRKKPTPRHCSFSFEHKTPKNKTGKSPKTSSSSKILDSNSGSFILAVTEGRGYARGEVGIAGMDPKRPHLVLCQISDSQKYVHSLAKMNVFDIVEVIVPNTFVDCTSPNKLYRDIRSAFPTVTLTTVQRRHFNEGIGIDLIKQYCSPESKSVLILLCDKFYALSAAAALIKYVEFTQNVNLAPCSLKIEYQGMEDTMIIGVLLYQITLIIFNTYRQLIVVDACIDLNTANRLELVTCINHPETNFKNNLLGVVNYCQTKGGVRLLRANILQPSYCLTKIKKRLDCVTELINNPLLFCSLEAALINFKNVESLLNLCMHPPQQEGLQVAEYQLKYTLSLKTVLEHLPVLNTSLKEARSDYFCEVRENLDDPRYTIILSRILETIFENAKIVKGSVAAHLHGCFAIKAGVNNLLDIAKKTYCEIVQEISDHVTRLRETYNMPLRISFSSNKGFHIQYTLPPGQRILKGSHLPKEFILIQKHKATFSCYTSELVALDQRSQHVLDEIKLMANVILYELLTDIRHHVGCLFNLCEFIAELDVLVSFAHVGSGTNYVRPNFGDELNLINSRHPILDVIHDGEVIPNDVFGRVGENLTILTGPNQSGKSIYIRQIALLQIMAQIGCYVPAKEATFRLTDRIFSRIGFDDSIESNASTLIVEMKDVEYLKQNVTPRSLVIIDELCRGTSVDEGTCLAFAICEEFVDLSAFIYFTTHYLLVTKLEELYYSVANYHFETNARITTVGKPSIRFTHLRRPGVTKSELYGLQIAKMTSFPKDILSKANDICLQLSHTRKPFVKIDGLLARYKLSLQFKNDLLKWGTEIDWKKIEPVVQNFKHKYLSLNTQEKSRTEGAEFLDERSELSSTLSMKKKIIKTKSVRKLLVMRLSNNIKKKYKELKLRKNNKGVKRIQGNG